MRSGKQTALRGELLLGLLLVAPTAAKILRELGTVAATLATALATIATAHLVLRSLTCESQSPWNALCVQAVQALTEYADRPEDG